MAITERSAVETLSPVVPVVREGAGGIDAARAIITLTPAEPRAPLAPALPGEARFGTPAVRPEMEARVERAAVDGGLVARRREPTGDPLYFPCTFKRADGSFGTYHIKIKDEDCGTVKALMEEIRRKSPTGVIDLARGVIRVENEIQVVEDGHPCFAEMNEMREIFNKATSEVGIKLPVYKHETEERGNPEGSPSLSSFSERIAGLRRGSPIDLANEIIKSPAFKGLVEKIPSEDLRNRIYRVQLVDKHLEEKRTMIIESLEANAKRIREELESAPEGEIVHLRKEGEALRKQLETLDETDRFALVVSILFSDPIVKEGDQNSFRDLRTALRERQDAIEAFISGKKMGKKKLLNTIPTPFSERPSINENEREYIKDLVLFSAARDQFAIRRGSYALEMLLKKDPKELGLLEFLHDGDEEKLIRAEQRAGLSPLPQERIHALKDEDAPRRARADAFVRTFRPELPPFVVADAAPALAVAPEEVAPVPAPVEDPVPAERIDLEEFPPLVGDGAPAPVRPPVREGYAAAARGAAERAVVVAPPVPPAPRAAAPVRPVVVAPPAPAAPRAPVAGISTAALRRQRRRGVLDPKTGWTTIPKRK